MFKGHKKGNVNFNKTVTAAVWQKLMSVGYPVMEQESVETKINKN